MAKEVLMTKRISTLLEELIEAARTMVQAGIPCVVVKPGAKEPVPSSEGGWLIIEDEGGLEETLSNAYKTNGGLNLAITAGQQRRSPVVVVDVDDEPGSRLARDLGFDPSHDCWLEITGSRHYAAVYYCRDTEGLKRRIHTGNTGLDLIVAGYQLIPPSITKGPYHWKPGHSPTDIPFSELQDLPGQMLDYWRAESGVTGETPQKRISAESLLGETITAGARNESLFWLACYLRRSHPQSVVESLVNSINLTHCNPPLDLSEIKNICRSAARYGNTDSYRSGVEVEL
jgi:hypothetical protein